MPALKDIGRMSSLLGVSPLASSSLWEKEVDRIHPIQLDAFVKRLAMQGQKDAAETALSICFAEIAVRVAAGAIPRPMMLDYSAPNRVELTAGELRDGLNYMGREKGAAVLYALESRISGHDVGRLTWNQAMNDFRDGKLTVLAQACTKVCPRQLRFNYVFWTTDPELDLPAPMFSLEADVFDAFGLVWAELAEAYGRMVMIDPKADAADFMTRLGLAGGAGRQPGVDH